MALYFLDHVGFTRSWGAPRPFYTIVDPGLQRIAGAVLMCWLWGLIVEIVAGESPIPRLENFRSNLAKGWWIVATALLIPWIVHILVFLLTGQETYSIALLTCLLYVFIAYWAAGEFFKIKYKHLCQRPINDIFWSGGLVIYGIMFTLLSLGLHWLSVKTWNLPLINPLIEILQNLNHFLIFSLSASIFSAAYPEVAEHFNSPKTLILINPSAGSLRAEAFSPVVMRRYPPFFTVLKALTPADYRIIEYNRVTWREHFYRDKALVAITCFTTNCAAAYQMAGEFRKRGANVILGGPHVTFFPEEALEFCDSVVVGPAESVWAEIISDYENNRLQRLYQGRCRTEDSLRVHQFMLKEPPGIINDCLQASPGCKFNCYFCSATALSKGVQVKKTVADLLPLIEKVAAARMPVTFIDNNIYEDPDYAKELFGAMKPLRCLWAGSTSIDIAKDDEALRLMKESGCFQLLIGYEIDAGSTTDMKGKFAHAKNYMELTKKLKQKGLLIQGQFIFGFPGDSWRSLLRLWWFCFRLSPAFTVVTFLTPLPGSRYFDECVNDEKLLNLNWRQYDLFRQVVETPRLKSSWFLQNAFSLISFFFLFTTSLTGRILLALGIVMEIVYYHP
ncbi:MAG: cobalamin-dependent protein [Candidatus Omnitrophota bacterium]